jgi:ribosomal protein L36
MKVLNSLKSGRGKVFVICKSNPRFKARQR